MRDGRLSPLVMIVRQAAVGSAKVSIGAASHRSRQFIFHSFDNADTSVKMEEQQQLPTLHINDSHGVNHEDLLLTPPNKHQLILLALFPLSTITHLGDSYGD